jgi:hypothetical protein
MLLRHYPTTLDVNELEKYSMVQLLFLTFFNVCYLDKKDITLLTKPRFEILDLISAVQDSNGCGTVCEEN